MLEEIRERRADSLPQVGDRSPSHDDHADHPDGDATNDSTGVSMELLDALRPYLAESLMVLDRDWTVAANLAPPGGLIGRGLGVGLHTLEDMHPDDLMEVLDLGAQAFATERGWRGSIIVRMHRGDGSYGRYEITAVNQFDHPVIGGMVVRTREVPDEALNHFPGLERKLVVETLAELLPIGVLLLDGNGEVVFVNETACGMMGREAADLKHEGLTPLVHEADRVMIADCIARVTAAAGREDCMVRFAGANIERGECRFCSEGDDEVSMVAVIIEDVTQRWAAERALEERANRDGLTGLRNRESLHDVLADRLRRGEPTTVAYVDLDDFKQVNDTWGHARGDKLLEDIAAALVVGVRSTDEIGRIGGDEFVVVTEETDGDALTSRLQSAVASVSVAGQPVEFSVGIAHAAPADSLRDLLHRADQAMYGAKRARRTTR